LLAQTSFVSDADIRVIPSHIELAAKDAPILAAAVAASADFLATGDWRHFSLLYDTVVSYVRIIKPTEFLRLHKDRLIE
jgi:predicted nucleic acid-binding protein